MDVCDALTDHSSEFIEQLHDKIIDLEDNLLDQQIPPHRILALLRKQLIVMRRYMAPQRDVYARLLPVNVCRRSAMTNAVGCRILPIALGAALTKSTPVVSTDWCDGG